MQNERILLEENILTVISSTIASSPDFHNLSPHVRSVMVSQCSPSGIINEIISLS